jgi:hypothetical protein
MTSIGNAATPHAELPRRRATTIDKAKQNKNSKAKQSIACLGTTKESCRLVCDHVAWCGMRLLCCRPVPL